MSPQVPHLPSGWLRQIATSKGFSLVELLTIIAIIGILAAASETVVPSFYQSGQLDENVSTLAGIFEHAREAAISGNTYVWVVFTANPPTSFPAGGVGVAVIESQDGTDSLSNFTLGTTASPLAINTANDLMVLHKLQTLPGIQVTASGAISLPSLPSLTTAGASLQSSMDLTLNAGGTTCTFTQGVEFTPDGEVRVSGTWNDLVEFGVKSSINPQSPNVAVMRLTRLTGRLALYRR
jgi:prepilin-type N-terminal cleavage/methylation domain-containing protein